MSKEYFVTSVEICEKCRGSGYAQDALWARFFAEHGEAYRQATEPAERERLLGGFFAFTFARSPRKRPSEEYPCNECKGAGKIERRCSLAEALEALGVPVAEAAA